MKFSLHVPNDCILHVLAYLGVPYSAAKAIIDSSTNSIFVFPEILKDLQLYRGRRSHWNYITKDINSARWVSTSSTYAEVVEDLELKLLTFVEFQNPTAMFALAMLACYRHEDFGSGMLLLKKASTEGFLFATFEMAALYACSSIPSHKYKSYKLLKVLSESDNHPLACLQLGDGSASIVRAGKNQLKHKEWLAPFVSNRTECLRGPFPYPTISASIEGKCESPRCINHVYSPSRSRQEWLEEKQHSFHWMTIRSRIADACKTARSTCFIVPTGTTCTRCGYVLYCCEACRIMDWDRHLSTCGVMEQID